MITTADRAVATGPGHAAPARPAWAPWAGRTVRARAPLRISFAGGGTDLPHYYEAHGGAVVSGTIDRYAYATVTGRPDGRIRLRARGTDLTAEFDLTTGPVYDGTLDLVKATVYRAGLSAGADVEVASDAPPGSGLGGSSALTAAVLRALLALSGRAATPRSLAELSFRVEREDLGIPGGKQDQYATAFGGLNFFEFRRGGVRVERLPVGPARAGELARRLLLCFTGSARTDTEPVARRERLYRAGREETLAGLRALHALAYDLRAALAAGRLERVGELIHAGYLHKRRTDPALTEGTAADRLYDTAMRSGATGGKLCGAGGGGYLLFFCPPDRLETVRRRLEADGGRCSGLAFEPRGARSWPGEETRA